jgi:hypothetical protein
MPHAEHDLRCSNCKQLKLKKLFTAAQASSKKPVCKECSHNRVSILSSSKKIKRKNIGGIVSTKYGIRPSKPKSNKGKIYNSDKYNQMYNEAKKKIFELFGLKCKRCKETDKRVLQLDHINGGGTRERKKLNSLSRYRKALKEPSKYQLLCANCNIIKKYENEEK